MISLNIQISFTGLVLAQTELIALLPGGGAGGGAGSLTVLGSSFLPPAQG